MALTELQRDGYPLIQRIDGGWVETRLFRTTDETYLEDTANLSRGTLADTTIWTQTTYPLRYKDFIYRRTSRTDNGYLVWEIEITATDLASVLSGNPDQSELEEVELDATPMFDSTGNINFLERIKKTTYLRINTQSDLNQVNTEREKIGLVNAAANNPFQGTVAGEWRCVNVKGNRTGATLNLLELVYFYERAPRKSDGSNYTWSEWGAEQSPAQSFATGDIAPLRL